MRIIVVVVMLIFCLFMGVTAISLGVGALFPSINKIAGPVMCPNGTMTPESKMFRPYPGKNVLTVNWYCVGPQSKTELNKFLVSLYAGSIYGFILFLVLFFLMILKFRKKAS